MPLEWSADRLSALGADDVHLFEEPWYHDFSALGLKTPQKPGIFGPNQQAKQRPMFELIEKAISFAQNAARPGTVVELFCADALFGLYAVQQGASSLLGMDIGMPNAGGQATHLRQAALASKLLGLSDRAAFEDRDVNDLDGTFDIGICAGGLYHVHDPAGLLRRLRSHISCALVIQTVFSLANTAATAFELSPPRRAHGCRFSKAWIERAVAESGWHILETVENELPGNEGLEDRGSLYLLCKP